eukprot:CAMPEP_0119112674 /NCGR_PEP_ID=MMETSP1180-20130426/41198_1 /TAXON_ID=3052 ORGANISM="Chlamydomonas cf sp, Strain CCMP681" /NCGR_SAMPLE_ID=MMETSP1180 /ASSEMBLY_ACC=CAM_ASM_000741 /LENGTH=35 /DNA_ID= /DNA_START= /DNA_END= /DNA_ORIENTATION=
MYLSPRAPARAPFANCPKPSAQRKDAIPRQTAPSY